ncbi:MAG: DUF4493 domain-containing protein [Muribaculaceae bacterium]|nr:DUF4493 domain-containing protein [Muribaculaceae bacterium]
MKLLQKSMLFGAAAVIMTSCSQDAPWGAGKGEGEIHLNLSAYGDVTAAAPSVRAVSTDIVVPPVADFQVKVAKLDGSYSESFSTVEDFVNKGSFPAGSYEIEAWYGEPGSQGFVKSGEEDYAHAYYYGKSTNITVMEGQTTEVQLSASLNNAIIVIEYTDAFKTYFTDWSTSVQTSGYSPVDFGAEEGLSYVIPGTVNVTISAELPNGNRISLSPGSFDVAAQHMYKMRYNIYDGEVGKADRLEITFDDSLETEPIYIDLSGELENTAAPVVTPEGFVDGQNFVMQRGTSFDGEVKFNVAAAGTIAAANLTIESDSYTPSFLTNGTIDLCSATETQKAEMEMAGIKAVGFFRNPGKMAQLDLTEMCRNLPEGKHRILFQVKDTYTQVNTPVSVGLACIPVDMGMTAEPAPFGEGYADIIVSYNGPDPTAPGSNPFTFRTQGNNGYVDSEIISITKKESTRAFESYDYVYRITVPDVDRDKFTVRAYFGSETAAGPDMTTDVEFEYPDYQVQLDPMTQKLRINVVHDDPKKKTLFFHKLKVFINGTRLSEGSFSRDEPTGLIAVYDLQPSTQYRVQTTLQSAENATQFGSDETITTSPATPVPNGDFSETAQTINKKLRVGGEWLCGAITYHTDCLIQYSEPIGGWASINKKTFYEGADPQNTWFMAASTFKSGSDVVIRTVGYNHSGTVPARTGSFTSTKHYNTDAPPYSDFTRVSGELFLGSYDFNGSETKSEGVAFNARPTSMTFKYKYEPQQTSSRASVEVTVYAVDGTTVLNHRKIYLYDTSSMTDYKLVLYRYPFGVQAGKLAIKFLSSDLEEGVSIETKWPKGDDLNQGKGLNSNDIDTNAAKALCVGSVLTISDLKFIYGEKQNE